MKTIILKIIITTLVVSFFCMCHIRNNKEVGVKKVDKLSGIWGKTITENANFRILDDSIYYPDYFKYYKYTTEEDSIFIHFDNWIFKGTYSFRNDSLVIESKNKEDIYVRFAE